MQWSDYSEFLEKFRFSAVVCKLIFSGWRTFAFSETDYLTKKDSVIYWQQYKKQIFKQSQRIMKNDIWCNPLPLENYPLGMLAPGRRPISEKAADNYVGKIRDFRG